MEGKAHILTLTLGQGMELAPNAEAGEADSADLCGLCRGSDAQPALRTTTF